MLGGSLFRTAWREAHAAAGVRDDAWSDAARAFIEQHLAKGRPTLDTLAAHFGLSTDRARHRFTDA